MGKKRNGSWLFNLIAPVYGWFYNAQKKRYRSIIAAVKEELDLTEFQTIVDVGCGTGALCSALAELDLDVTGIDSASKMLRIARRKNKDTDIQFIEGNIFEDHPLPNKGFDVAIASYVAHGMGLEERHALYRAMRDLAKEYVIFHDYNRQRAPVTSMVEWMEGGDYFYFIENAEQEMKNCMEDLKTCFEEVRVVNVDIRANWYICKIHKQDDDKTT
jgi:SAM-dependent methyltransferase